jgi:hypothetical protein
MLREHIIVEYGSEVMTCLIGTVQIIEIYGEVHEMKKI